MTYEPMRRDEIDECAELAVQAFFTYEYFTNYFPDEAARLDFMRKMLTCVYRTNYGKAHYLVGKENGKIVAVADLHAPDYRKPGDLAYMLHGWWRVMLIRPAKLTKLWLQMDEEAGAYCHALNQGTTWYVSSLTIHPDHQGRGLGTAMLTQGIMPYIQQRGATQVCLFTNSEQNLRFYTHLGFEIKDIRQFEYNGHTMGSWSLTKEVKNGG